MRAMITMSMALVLVSAILPGALAAAERNAPPRPSHTTPRAPDRNEDVLLKPRAAPRASVTSGAVAPPALAAVAPDAAFEYACTAADAALKQPSHRPALPSCATPFLVTEQLP